MAGRPRTPEGEKIRDAILVMLRRAEIDFSPKPSFTEIGKAVGRRHQTVTGYLRSMRRDDLVTWIERQPRTLTLTEIGRVKADQLLTRP